MGGQGSQHEKSQSFTHWRLQKTSPLMRSMLFFENKPDHEQDLSLPSIPIYFECDHIYSKEFVFEQPQCDNSIMNKLSRAHHEQGPYNSYVFVFCLYLFTANVTTKYCDDDEACDSWADYLSLCFLSSTFQCFVWSIQCIKTEIVILNCVWVSLVSFGLILA